MSAPINNDSFSNSHTSSTTTSKPRGRFAHLTVDTEEANRNAEIRPPVPPRGFAALATQLLNAASSPSSQSLGRRLDFTRLDDKPGDDQSKPLQLTRHSSCGVGLRILGSPVTPDAPNELDFGLPGSLLEGIPCEDAGSPPLKKPKTGSIAPPPLRRKTNVGRSEQPSRWAASELVATYLDLRSKLAKNPRFVNLKLGSDESIKFNIRRKIDPSMGQYSDVYVGDIVLNGFVKPCVLKVFKDFLPDKYLSHEEAVCNNCANQLINYALRKDIKAGCNGVATFMNFDRHLAMIGKWMHLEPEERRRMVKEYVATQSSLAFQLAFYIPEAIPKFENQSDLEDSTWKQIAEQIKWSFTERVMTDAKLDNFRMDEFGRVFYVDLYEKCEFGLGDIYSHIKTRCVPTFSDHIEVQELILQFIETCKKTALDQIGKKESFPEEKSFVE